VGPRQIQGKRACFYSVVDLVNQLDAEKRAGRAGHLANRLLNQDAIVLDELGYLPFSADGGALLFHLISKLYERVSLITTKLVLRRMERRVRRRQDDHRLARSTHASMRNHRDRQRRLSLQETSMRAKYKKNRGPKVKGYPSITALKPSYPVGF
jgi:DNA replication protein DnaC